MHTLFSNIKLENEVKLSRQQYTPEFKRRTLELLAESGKSVPKLAKELGISENTVYGWRHTAKTDTGFIRQPQSFEQALEIRRLKKKISELEVSAPPATCRQ